MNKVYSLGSFYDNTAPYVVKAKEMEKEKERKRYVQNYVAMNKENRRDSFDYEQDPIEAIISQMDEVVSILKKAGIDSKFFPFKPQRDKNGEIIGFKPKGKNDKEIKEDIEEYKAKIQEALELGKITQEEFDTLEDNLEDLMKENEIEFDEEEKLEVTDEEIMRNIKGFIAHNFGDMSNFEDKCKEYEEYDLDDRKFQLQEFNSKINTQLGIAGDLKFSNNPNLKFENSFFDKGHGGYYLTEEDVAKKGLGPALYTMMEKSMMRQLEQKREQKISPEQKKAMHEKIMEEKKKREQQKERAQEKLDKERAHARIRSLYGG